MQGKSKAPTENIDANITKGKLLLYVSSNDITFEGLLEAANIHDADEDTVEVLYDMDFEVLIDVYCTISQIYCQICRFLEY